MSRAKANWLRAFNKVRMQLQEVSDTVSPCPHLSTATTEPMPTTEPISPYTRKTTFNTLPLLNNIILIISPLRNKPMLTTTASRPRPPTPQKTTPNHTQQYHTHHPQTHSSIAPLQTDVRVPASTLLALFECSGSTCWPHGGWIFPVCSDQNWRPETFT